MPLQRLLLLLLLSFSVAMVSGKEAVADRLVSTNPVGGDKVYTSRKPLLRKDHHYRGILNEYSGSHFSNWAIYGRNSDKEDWTRIHNFLGDRAASFISPGDYRQIKVSWSKSEKEPDTTIAYTIAEDKADHSTAYVSASAGKDSNDGSEKSPFATIAKAIAMKPKTIRLRRGDVFYESVRSDGINFATYSTGDKPELCGLKILPSHAWELAETLPGGMKIWKVNLALDRQAYGGRRFSGNNFQNNIGGFVRTGESPADSRLCGSKRVQSYDELKGKDARDFDFYQPVDNPTKTTPAKNFDCVYVCFRGHPDDSYGVITGSNGMEIGDCRVDSLKICYWGRHGIAGKSNVTITGCDIDGIGGMVQLGYPVFVCLGNGIEFYVQHPGVSDCHVTGCHVSHCYDAGLTVQGTEHDATNMQPLEVHDVTFTHNRIENCCQSFEEFLNGNNPSDLYYNCTFADNVSIRPGIDTGFRYSDGRYKRSHILTYENNKSTGMVYSSNVCTDGNYLCVLTYQGKYAQGTWLGNKCAIRRGQDLLGNYKGTADVVTVPTDKGNFSTLKEADDAAIARYRALTGDTTTEFTIID